MIDVQDGYNNASAILILNIEYSFGHMQRSRVKLNEANMIASMLIDTKPVDDLNWTELSPAVLTIN